MQQRKANTRAFIQWLQHAGGGAGWGAAGMDHRASGDRHAMFGRQDSGLVFVHGHFCSIGTKANKWQAEFHQLQLRAAAFTPRAMQRRKNHVILGDLVQG